MLGVGGGSELSRSRQQPFYLPSRFGTHAAGSPQMKMSLTSDLFALVFCRLCNGVGRNCAVRLRAECQGLHFFSDLLLLRIARVVGREYAVSWQRTTWCTARLVVFSAVFSSTWPLSFCKAHDYCSHSQPATESIPPRRSHAPQHMQSHVEFRTGQWHEASEANLRAVALPDSDASYPDHNMDMLM